MIMNDYHEIFLNAIHSRNHLHLTFNANEKGLILRQCIPFDFGPSNRYKDGNNRYHLYDLDSPEGKHNLSILPIQLIKFELSKDLFDPAHYVTWTPRWHIARDWGIYS
jgi:hypothetical protein